MPEPVAYLDGRFLPASQLSVPVYDAGFVQGVTVAEQLRTFGGQLFRLEQHLDRLRHCLEIVGVDPGRSMNELAAAARELASRNHRLLESGDDLGLCLFVTPGAYPAMVPQTAAPPMVAMHTFPLPFHLWCDKYERGQRLVTTDIVQVPPTSWPPELKCRSRMHYYLADRQAQRIDPDARAVLLDQRGMVVEASTANVVIYRHNEGIVSPPRESILPGVSIAVLSELAEQAGIPFSCRDVPLDDLTRADEVLLSSTSPCLLPVVSVNGQPVGSGAPGNVFRRALEQWGGLVGQSICDQAQRFRRR
jgi:branched-subunit amino acid aminotransferase/4-amino-4-deoxychorismate lyase